MNTKKISIFEIAKSMSDKNVRFDISKKKCKDALISFFEVNEYFGLNVNEETYEIPLNDVMNISEKLELWIRSYEISDEDKLELLIHRMKTTIPKTGALFSEFILNKKKNLNVAAAWRLADFLCYILKDELTETENAGLDEIAEEINKQLPLNSAKMYTEFLLHCHKNNDKQGWLYNFNSRGYNIETSSYSVKEFLRMAYIVFNDEAWEKEKLMEKALSSQQYANLWVYVSMHFICGWRGNDIIRLPMPKIQYTGNEIRQQIKNHDFDAETLINDIEFRLRYLPMKPGKTEDYNNIPDLKLFVPESLRKPFGIILGIAISFNEGVEPGKPFIKKPNSIQLLKDFFGKEFYEACDRRMFSSRRANKSYLQGIEVVADSSPGKPKGYMLAALARSHKSGYGKLPETTEIYLNDAKFSGYRPEFIAQQMFERGVFSFIPSLMLDMYANDDYEKLPIPFQTKLIAELGLNASEIESVSKMIKEAYIKAYSAISYILQESDDIHKNVANILQNIASGNAPGRQDGVMCLMTAAGQRCKYSERSCCIGCGFEIYTKTLLHCLTKEYARIIDEKKSASDNDKQRYSKILKQTIMPIISEMFAVIKKMYPDCDIKSLADTLKLGVVS